METPLLIGLVVMLAFGSFALFSWWNSEAERTKRALRHVAIRPIQSLREGEVLRVQGKLLYLDPAPLESPISQRRCALYRVVVDVKKGKNSTETVIDESEGRSFLLQDETGTARIQLSDYKLAIDQDHHQTSGTFDDPPSHVIDFLQARGQTHTGLFGMNLSMTYNEGVLEQGEIVTVLGRVRFEHIDDSAQAAGYRDRPRRAVLISPDDSPMLISDEPSVTGPG